MSFTKLLNNQFVQPTNATTTTLHEIRSFLPKSTSYELKSERNIRIVNKSSQLVSSPGQMMEALAYLHTNKSSNHNFTFKEKNYACS